MSEAAGFKPEVTFTPPPIDLQAEVVKPEQEAELQAVIEKYSHLIGTRVTERGMREFYEDIFHSEQYGYLAIDDFFVDGTDDILTGRVTSSDKEDLLSFCEELVNFSIRRLGGNQLAQSTLEATNETVDEHVDANATVLLANFDVVGEMYYELRPFINDATQYEQKKRAYPATSATPSIPLDPDKTDNRHTFFNNTIRIPIKSNQMVFLERTVPGGIGDSKSRVTLPHAVKITEGDDTQPEPSRIRLIVSGQA